MLKVLLFIFLSFQGFTKTFPQINLKEFSTQKTFSSKEQFKMSAKIVINFFASWCSNCIQELPDLEKLKATYSNQNISFIAINAGESKKKIKMFLRRYKFSYKILLDKNRIFSKSAGVMELPKTFVIDKSHNIIYEGSLPPKKL